MVTTTTTMVAKTHAYVIYQCESSVLHTLQYLLSDSMIGRTTMQLMCLGGPAEKYSEVFLFAKPLQGNQTQWSTDVANVVVLFLRLCTLIYWSYRFF